MKPALKNRHIMYTANPSAILDRIIPINLKLLNYAFKNNRESNFIRLFNSFNSFIQFIYLAHRITLPQIPPIMTPAQKIPRIIVPSSISL